jgi:polar amino acid transport system substrate-binding protein
MRYFTIFLMVLFFNSNTAFSIENDEERVESCDIENNKAILISGWFDWEPYQYTKISNNQEILTGMDLALMKRVFKEVGSEVIIDRVSWDKHIQDIKTGQRDIATGATYTRDRAEFAFFSDPYRYEENVLIISKQTEKSLAFDNIPELLAQIRAQNFRLGVLDGGIYADESINNFIMDRSNADIIVKSNDDIENIKNLLKGSIDGFIVDRLVGASVVLKFNAESDVREVDLKIKTPISFMLSKKTNTPEFMNEVNKSISKIKNSGEFDEISREYLFPVLLLQIISSDWFGYITIIGIISFSISGVLIALKENMTLFNTILISSIPTSIVGVFRDSINSSADQYSVAYSTKYLLISFILVIFCFSALRTLEIFNKQASKDKELEKFLSNLFIYTESLGQASFIIVGVACTIVFKFSPIEVWGPIFAFIISNLGSVIRDLFTREKIITALNSGLRPEICLLWGLIFSIFLKLNSSSPDITTTTIAAITILIGALASLVLVHLFKIENIRFR